MESDDGTFDGAELMTESKVYSTLEERFYQENQKTGLRHVDLVVFELEDK
jgi:hypothetical protein